jgi:hypothetical protein
MNLSKRDQGKQFVAPSGRRVEFVAQQSDDRYVFVYVDDRDDGLALSQDGLRILERVGTRHVTELV